jgi:hypothetical protein
VRVEIIVLLTFLLLAGVVSIMGHRPAGLVARTAAVAAEC